MGFLAKACIQQQAPGQAFEAAKVRTASTSQQHNHWRGAAAGILIALLATCIITGDASTPGMTVQTSLIPPMHASASAAAPYAECILTACAHV